MKPFVKFYRSLFHVMVVSGLSLIDPSAFADVPRHFSYQGFLKDANGNPKAGSVDLVIEFYDAESEGERLYSEEFNNVELDNGVYSIQVGMGAISSGSIMDLIDPQKDQIWLSETVDQQVLTPRIKIGSSIFSLKARYSEELLIPDNSGSAVNVNNLGYIGIGRRTPEDESPEDPVELLSILVEPSGDQGIVLTEGSMNGGRISYNEQGNYLRIAGYNAGSIQEAGGIIIPRETGNVGIGTINPQESLEVEGSIRANNDIIAGFGSPISPSIRFPDRSENTGFSSPSAETLSILTNSTERMCITSAGNVGIGRTNPQTNLEVEGSIRATNDIIAGFGSPISPSIRFSNRSENTGFSSPNAETLSFLTNSEERMRITSAGNVGIGTTEPQQTLDVNGTIGSEATVYHSDSRWKKNIDPLGDGLERVVKLRGVNYEWRTDKFKRKNFDKGKQIGFIAQEVEKVLPEVVNTNANGYKSLDYARITVVLVEAVKELNSMHEVAMEHLKKEVQTVKEENTRLNAVINDLKDLPAQVHALQQQLGLINRDQDSALAQSDELD